MAASNIGNPAGLQNPFEDGEPSIIGGYVRNAQISGGVFVFASGAGNVVSSGLNSFVTADLLFAADASGAAFNGVAVNTAAVSGPISVLTRGFVICVANNTVNGGYLVQCDGNNSVANVGSVAANLTTTRPIGRAITDATSGNYCIVEIK